MSNTPASCEARELVELFHRLGPAYLRWTARAIPTEGPSPARIRLLLRLRDNGPLPMHALRADGGTTAANVTKLVDALEAEGLVKRGDDPKDARVSRIKITVAGRRVVDGAWEAYLEKAASLFDRLPGTGRRQLAENIGILLAVLGEADSDSNR
jgi:DNA-binding MarR family transcriptional regulator